MGSRALFFAIAILILAGCKSKEYISQQAIDTDSAKVSLYIKDSICMRESLAIRGETIVYVRNIVQTTNNKRDSVILHEVQETKKDVPKTKKDAPKESKNNNLIVIIYALFFLFLYKLYKYFVNR